MQNGNLASGKKKARIKTTVLVVILGALIPLAFFILGYSEIIKVPCFPMKLTDEMKNSRLYKDLSSGRDVCFIGDSISEGTTNGHHPWFEPLSKYITGEVVNFSQGGITSGEMAEVLDYVPKSDVYVVALGTNDILHGVPLDSYKSNISAIHDHLKKIAPGSTIYFIAPWTFVDDEHDNVKKAQQAYWTVLEEYCNMAGDIPINSTPYILEKTAGHLRYYMTDILHPNEFHGIYLYCEAILLSCPAG